MSLVNDCRPHPQEGRVLAAARAARLQRALADHPGETPCLAVLDIGSTAADRARTAALQHRAQRVGLRVSVDDLPGEIGEPELLERIAALGANADVHAILIGTALPDHIDPAAVRAALPPAKDLARAVGDGPAYAADGDSRLPPGAAAACRVWLGAVLPAGAFGRRAVVIGATHGPGPAIAEPLLRDGCTATLAHPLTRGLPALCRAADIVIAALDRPKMVPERWIRSGAAVIDLGQTRGGDGLSGRLRVVGDLQPAAARRAGAMASLAGDIAPLAHVCVLEAAFALARGQVETPTARDPLAPSSPAAALVAGLAV
ncbi:hypothetical protein SAOR_05205 [Salinisphaera orenii MK-B5]|uniref:Methylenetetrahydrofolate dehydrogenase n=1 Tax=Salinisphaera orenii MK-B5 TaxID=856730 RepID=A0A423PTI2_9GAMM|nr:tetrahydrofolate dehydrogenase/cyclohydrolase catalytic domain-containing protein [Salinisphaera orenii]ROO28915.1 hypothetical protein SAOR_05205 [Salinisphaera orenii MK-B5]